MDTGLPRYVRRTSAVSDVGTSEPSTVEYPLLGEPAVVEFLNTLYRGPDQTFDFLGDVDLARGWFRAVAPTILLRPESVGESERRALVELRSAIRTVFNSAATKEIKAVIPVLEMAVNSSPARVRIVAIEPDRLVARTVHDLSEVAGTTALLAHAAITIASDDTRGRVLVCDRPGCYMHYLQHHRRRRYCNPACANAHRQSRFQQRIKS